MFGWLFGGLHSLLDTVVWIGLIGGTVIFLACVAISTLFPRLLTAVIAPFHRPVMLISGAVAVACALIKLAAVVAFFMTAQTQIKELKGQLATKQETINTMTKNAGRKQVQAETVTKGDAGIVFKYVDRWHRIGKIRENADIGDANQLMLDLTNNFYDEEKSNDVAK